jgi:hypothetical protein
VVEVQAGQIVTEKREMEIDSPNLLSVERSAVKAQRQLAAVGKTLNIFFDKRLGEHFMN